MNAGKLKIFIIAGEMSGDVLGAGLMQSLRARHDGKIEFRGVGGDLMTAQGLHSIFPMSEIAVMGFAELIPHIPRVLRRINETVRAIREWQPDVVVTIDAPGFNKRVAKKLGRGKIPLIHYVAPSVWAWRPGRAKTMAQFFDHLLCLFRCEPPYFQREGLAPSFIGHPVVDSDLGNGRGAQFRAAHNIDAQSPILCLLPGSRRGEVTRLLPLFLQCFHVLKSSHPNMRAVIPTVPHLLDTVRGMTDADIIVTADHAIKKDIFAASTVALAASGTVSLELAKVKLPMVIAYKVNALSAFIARRLVKLQYFTLTNILLNRPAIPEFFQEQATVENLTGAIDGLIQNEPARTAQIKSGQEALQLLQAAHGPTSSDAAAATILSYIKS